MAGLLSRVRGGLSRTFGYFGRIFVDRPVSTATLIEFTQSVRFFLSSGMTLRDTMRALAENGTRPTRRQAVAIAAELRAGYSFPDALKRQGRKFPPLFQSMAAVGDETGNLPEVMADLENYYELQQQLKREFRSQISWPIIQLVLAVMVVAGMIYFLGQIPQARSPVRLEGQSSPEAVEKLKLAMKAPTIDPLGVGEEGAILFLAYVFGLVAVCVFAFVLFRRVFRRRAFFERILLRVPFFGPCIEAIALSRFCFSMKLMLNTGLSVLETVRLGYGSTDNMAYIAAIPKSLSVLRRGNSLTTSMTATRLFPRRFMSAVAIGEESGHLTETMQNQGKYYDEVARQRMSLLNQLLATSVWLIVAGFVIVMIFRIFTGAYLKTINTYT